MALTPVGKIRLMQAQRMTNPLSKGYEDPYNLSWEKERVQSPSEQTGEDTALSPQIEEQKSRDPHESQGGKEPSSLKEFVFKRMQHFGWPGRLLQEFRDEFADIDVAADGTENAHVVIPDKKFGSGESITKHDVLKLAKEVEKLFKWHFNGAKNKAGRWNIEFTSINPNQINEEDVNVEGDGKQILEQVYGPAKGDKGGKNKQPAGKRASVTPPTLNEMIKSGKNNLIEALIKILSEKE